MIGISLKVHSNKRGSPSGSDTLTLKTIKSPSSIIGFESGFTEFIIGAWFGSEKFK